MQRLYTTPLTGFDFIMGYMLPLLPIAIGQVLICYLFAIPLGLTVSVNIVYAVIGIIPMAVFNISLGLFCGSVFAPKNRARNAKFMRKVFQNAVRNGQPKRLKIEKRAVFIKNDPLHCFAPVLFLTKALTY